MPEQDLDERSLAAAILRKDRKATAEFVARYADPLYSYLCRRLLPREDVVDDLFQQVFLEAWQKLDGWRGDATLQTWLLGIARHKVQDHYRSRLREFAMPEGVEEQLEDSSDLSAWLEGRDLQERIETTMGELPEQSRLLLLWRYWERLSAEKMARQTGKTVKGVERALARARAQFREIWERGGGNG